MVPAMLVMVAVAVAVHYQGSLRRAHRMIQTEIAGPNPTVVRTSPWTRTRRVWRAHRAIHNWLDLRYMMHRRIKMYCTCHHIRYTLYHMTA